MWSFEKSLFSNYLVGCSWHTSSTWCIQEQAGSWYFLKKPLCSSVHLQRPTATWIHVFINIVFLRVRKYKNPHVTYIREICFDSVWPIRYGMFIIVTPDSKIPKLLFRSVFKLVHYPPSICAQQLIYLKPLGHRVLPKHSSCRSHLAPAATTSVRMAVITTLIHDDLPSGYD